MLATRLKPAAPGGVARVPEDPRFTQVERALKRYRLKQDALIEVLHVAQEAYGYLDEYLLTHIAHQLRLPLSWVYGVASFYHYFTLRPQGKHTLHVCTGTACYVERANKILDALEAEFGIRAGETTPDGRVTLSVVRCPGSCGMAPGLILDGHAVVAEQPQAVVEQVRALLAREDAEDGAA